MSFPENTIPTLGETELLTLQKLLSIFNAALDNGALKTTAVLSGDVSSVPTGTAGTPDTHVVSVQGIASGTAQPVSLASVPTHAVTQSGTWNVVATNAGTFAVQAAQSGTWNITNISGTISLPTGAATEATLATLGGKVTACNTGAVVLAAGSAAIGSVTLGGAERAVAGTSYNANATIAAGHRSIGLIFSSDFTGSVAGVTFAGANDNTWSIVAPSGDTLGSVALVVTTGSVRAFTVG